MNNIKNLSTNILKNKIYVNINLALVLSVSIFWIYSINLYSVGSNAANYINIVVNILIIAFFVFINSNIKNENFKIKLIFSFGELLIFIIIFIFSLIMSYKNLNQPLWGDGIYHSSYSVRLGQYAIYYINQYFPYIWDKIKIVNASIIIQVVNLIICSIIFLLYLLSLRLHKKNKYIYVALISSALIITRCLVAYKSTLSIPLIEPFIFHYDWDVHPLLRLLPLFLSSTVFGVSDFGFRMSSLTTAAFSLLIIYAVMKSTSNSYFAFITVICLSSIPIFWHLSYILEPSIWVMLLGSIIFVIIINSSKIDEILLTKLLCIVLLGILLRTPAMVLLAPLFIIFIYGVLTEDYFLKKFKNPLTILLFILIILLLALYRGSPAVESISTLNKLKIAMENNIPSIAAASIFGLFPILLIGYSFRSSNAREFSIFLALTTYCGLSLLIFYGPIFQSSWGTSKYQAEIFVPMIAAGLSSYFFSYKDIAGSSKFIFFITSPILLVIFVNLYSLINFSNRDFIIFPNIPTPREAIKNEVEYPTNKAFDLIKENNLQENTFYVGVYYSGFLSALRGFDSKNFLGFSRLNIKHRNGFSVLSEGINKDLNIKSVIIESNADYSNLKVFLLDSGWKMFADFSDASKRHNVFVLTRN